MTRTKTKDLTLTAMMAAVICVLAPISIPIPVSSMPLSLGTFALYLTAYVLKPKMAFAATALYLLMGAVGLPVFAGYSAGFSRFAGAGGGYLTGYLFLVPACSICIRRFPQSPVVQIIGMLLATFLFYAYATYWMSAVNKAFAFTLQHFSSAYNSPVRLRPLPAQSRPCPAVSAVHGTEAHPAVSPQSAQTH